MAAQGKLTSIAAHLSQTQRVVDGDHPAGGAGHSVLLRRRYDAPVEDVWHACTDPDRISRWFLPVSGDLRAGGKYQFEGNAGGEILRCEPPYLLQVTWVFGGAPGSEVQVRLSADGGVTDFELEHSGLSDAAQWATFGPGAVGVGWDLALHSLGRHRQGEIIEDPQSWGTTPEAADFMTGSSQAWGTAFEAAGASAAQAAAATAQTTAFYVPRPSQ
jgi:uncharacterized protein YndB with AHSA1/START domain